MEPMSGFVNLKERMNSFGKKRSEKKGAEREERGRPALTSETAPDSP
jgi:hypothetical protein